MNIDRLRAVQAEERDADSLRPLPDRFYREVADYLQELREERKVAAESAADPFGAEDVRRLTDEIETAEEVAEAIYERRVGKLVKRASLAAAGMPVDEEGLTAEEAELFADLVDQIEVHRETVLASFAASGNRSPPARSDAPAADEATPEPPEAPGFDPADAMGGDDADPGDTAGAEAEPPGSDTAEDGRDADGTADDTREPADGRGGPESTAGDPQAEPADDPERVTVRITRDVGEVFGVDERVYDLAAEDVVTLPTANAGPLLDRDAAEKVE